MLPVLGPPRVQSCSEPTDTLRNFRGGWDGGLQIEVLSHLSNEGASMDPSPMFCKGRESAVFKASDIFFFFVFFFFGGGEV